MKTRTNVIISFLLALIITVFFINAQSKTTMNDLLKKTQLTHLDGKNFDKKSLKNKVVIISFFQTWCGDCVKEQPDLQKLKQKFGGKLEILMISDEPAELIAQFKDRFQSPLSFYHSSLHLKTDLEIRAYPTTYLFNQKGEVEIKKVEGIDWYTPEIIAKIEQLSAQ